MSKHWSIHTVVFSASVALVAVGCGGSNSSPTPAPVPSTDTSTPTVSETAATPDEHADPHDVPMTEAEIEQLKQETATYPAAVEQLKSFRETIQTETTGGEPAKAHRSLDKADLVLQWLPEIAQNSNVAKESWETVGENAQKVRDAFGKVHANIDAGTAPDYAAVQSDVDAGMDALSSVTVASTEAPQ
jgi:hypothetical protein